MKRQNKQFYAIIRIEQYNDGNLPLEERITVKEIVPTIEVAESYVKRLNKINSDKDCRYFWQTTRMSARAQEDTK